MLIKDCSFFSWLNIYMRQCLRNKVLLILLYLGSRTRSLQIMPCQSHTLYPCVNVLPNQNLYDFSSRPRGRWTSAPHHLCLMQVVTAAIQRERTLPTRRPHQRSPRVCEFIDFKTIHQNEHPLLNEKPLKQSHSGSVTALDGLLLLINMGI